MVGNNFQNLTIETQTTADQAKPAEISASSLIIQQQQQRRMMDNKSFSTEPIDMFIKQYPSSKTVELKFKPYMDSSSSSMDSKLFHDLEHLNMIKSSASKDRLMQNLLQKVRVPSWFFFCWRQ